MAEVLTFLAVGCLLQGVLCGQWPVNMPQNLWTLNGSCVIIPCSFDVEDKYKNDLNDNCEAFWKKKEKFTSEDGELRERKEMTGKITNKNCTTTLKNMQSDYNGKYYLRVDCKNEMKYTFLERTVNISVRVKPPSPTLTPSTLEVKEETSVSLMCSAPAPCWSHPPNLTWTPSLGESVETLQENQDKTKVTTSVMNFIASHQHNGMKITCTAAYRKQEGRANASAETNLTAVISYSPKNTKVSISPSGLVPEKSKVTLTCGSNANPAVKNYTWYRVDGHKETIIGTGATLTTEVSREKKLFFCKAENELGVGHSRHMQIDVQFPPQILPSSDCVKNSSRISCFCETAGDPSPTAEWYLNGLPINQSEKFEIIMEALNSTALRSIIAIQPWEGDLSTLLCRSFNSLGTSSQLFCVSRFQIFAKRQDPVLYLSFIATLLVLLAVLICGLLFVIRTQKNHYIPKSKVFCESGTVAKIQVQTRERNEAPDAKEDPIYANMDVLTQDDDIPEIY